MKTQEQIDNIECWFNNLIAYMDAFNLWEHYFSWREGEE